jgi:secreted PhoX family phosphatase
MHADPESSGVNPSSNLTFGEVLETSVSRRAVLRGGFGAAALAVLGVPIGLRSAAASVLFAFKGVPLSTADVVTVPEGYTAEVLYAWGDPVSEGPAFRPDAGNSAADQERQAGMHHDGIHYFPLTLGSNSSTRGLLAVNHEYTDDGLLHPGGMARGRPRRSRSPRRLTAWLSSRSPCAATSGRSCGRRRSPAGSPRARRSDSQVRRPATRC